MPPKKSEEKKKADEQQGPASANVSMANIKAPQASSSLDTQPPVWFLREMEKMTEMIQNTFAARLNQIDVTIEKHR